MRLTVHLGDKDLSQSDLWRLGMLIPDRSIVISQTPGLFYEFMAKVGCANLYELKDPAMLNLIRSDTTIVLVGRYEERCDWEYISRQIERNPQLYVVDIPRWR